MTLKRCCAAAATELVPFDDLAAHRTRRGSARTAVPAHYDKRNRRSCRREKGFSPRSMAVAIGLATPLH